MRGLNCKSHSCIDSDRNTKVHSEAGVSTRVMVQRNPRGCSQWPRY